MKTIVLCLSLIFFITACSEDGGSDNNSNDYRDEYIGNYSATKSNNSFEDENFRTEIDDIVIELASDSLILLDGVELLLNEDGTTGRQSVGGNVYILSFDENNFQLETYAVVPGLAISCYILGEKR